MKLSDALEEAKPKSQQEKIDLIRECLDEEDAKLLDRALKDKNLPSRQLGLALNKMGYKVSATSVQQYRRARGWIE